MSETDNADQGVQDEVAKHIHAAFLSDSPWDYRMSNAQATQNQLLRCLARLDPGVFARLCDDLQPVPLERGIVLGAPHEPLDWVYLLDSGVVSLVAETGGGQSLEVAIVGKEGVAGFADTLGRLGLPYRLIVQLSGLAYRARTAIVTEHVFSCTPLHELLMSYSQFMMHQLTQSALCSRFHGSVQRLARWLILTADRAGTNRCP